MSLSNNASYSMRSEGAHKVSKMLITNSTLKHLDLKGNQIGGDGVAFLVNVLVNHNTSLARLAMSDNKIRDKEGTDAIAELLEKNSTLRELQLNSNPIEGGIIPICKGMKHNHTLHALYLNSCGLGKYTQVIGDLIGTTHSLKILHLRENYITDAGLSDISSGLECNSSIMQLNLEYNSFGPLGIKTLVESLKKNKTLMKIYLSENKIQDGINHISDLLKYNSTLTSINLSNPYYKQGTVPLEPLTQFLTQLVNHKHYLTINITGIVENPLSIKPLILNVLENNYLIDVEHSSLGGGVSNKLLALRKRNNDKLIQNWNKNFSLLKKHLKSSIFGIFLLAQKSSLSILNYDLLCYMVSWTILYDKRNNPNQKQKFFLEI
uniref:Uncharacterized protein n=1 Tax=Arcella intermedia TaxID=1963864 RepID=A0A6B2L6J7_9EUKA